MTRQKLPPRSADLEYMLASVADGMCCSIVGLSNTGKSTLLRAARRGQQLLKSDAPGCAFFYVDCNLMLAMSEQGFYEAILRVVQAELKNTSAPQALVERVEDLYRRVVEPTSPFVVSLSFNESVVALCEQLERRVVFLLDEFDDPFARLDGRVFLNLRALRDKYGPRLCFVTATEKALPDSRSDAEAAEFSELFAGRTHPLKMLPPGEARQVVAATAQCSEVALDDEEMSFIVAQAGGHPGLLLAVAGVVLRVSSSTPAGVGTPGNLALVRQLLDSDASVRGECARLWSQLTETDQAVLLHLLTASEAAPPFESARQRLIENGILMAEPGARMANSTSGIRALTSVFSPLFETFARRQFRARLPAQSGVYVDVDSGEVWVDGRKVPTLTDLEYRLLLLLYGRLDKICDKYQVVEAVWGQEFIDDVDDSRVEKLISRLRQKLEANPANPRYFQTVRGRGYRLISG